MPNRDPQRVLESGMHETAAFLCTCSSNARVNDQTRCDRRGRQVSMRRIFQRFIDLLAAAESPADVAGG